MLRWPHVTFECIYKSGNSKCISYKMQCNVFKLLCNLLFKTYIYSCTCHFKRKLQDMQNNGSFDKLCHISRCDNQGYCFPLVSTFVCGKLLITLHKNLVQFNRLKIQLLSNTDWELLFEQSFNYHGDSLYKSLIRATQQSCWCWEFIAFSSECRVICFNDSWYDGLSIFYRKAHC